MIKNYEPSNEELITETAVLYGEQIGLERSHILDQIAEAKRNLTGWLMGHQSTGETMREKQKREYCSCVKDAAENGQVTWWNVEGHGGKR